MFTSESQEKAIGLANLTIINLRQRWSYEFRQFYASIDYKNIKNRCKTFLTRITRCRNVVFSVHTQRKICENHLQGC